MDPMGYLLRIEELLHKICIHFVRPIAVNDDSPKSVARLEHVRALLIQSLNIWNDSLPLYLKIYGDGSLDIEKTLRQDPNIIWPMLYMHMCHSTAIILLNRHYFLSKKVAIRPVLSPEIKKSIDAAISCSHLAQKIMSFCSTRFAMFPFTVGVCVFHCAWALAAYTVLDCSDRGQQYHGEYRIRMGLDILLYALRDMGHCWMYVRSAYLIIKGMLEQQCLLTTSLPGLSHDESKYFYQTPDEVLQRLGSIQEGEGNDCIASLCSGDG
jgi:hypothetical protein